MGRSYRTAIAACFTSITGNKLCTQSLPGRATWRPEQVQHKLWFRIAGGRCASLPDAATARRHYSAAIAPGVFAREAILRRTMSM